MLGDCLGAEHPQTTFSIMFDGAIESTQLPPSWQTSQGRANGLDPNLPQGDGIRNAVGDSHTQTKEPMQDPRRKSLLPVDSAINASNVISVTDVLETAHV